MYKITYKCASKITRTINNGCPIQYLKIKLNIHWCYIHVAIIFMYKHSLFMAFALLENV